jgi:hypothetical protein
MDNSINRERKRKLIKKKRSPDEKTQTHQNLKYFGNHR